MKMKEKSHYFRRKKKFNLKLSTYIKYKICKIFFIFILLYALFNNTNIQLNINKKRIFVSFMYNNEAEMVYIHIWRLYNYVDKFIIVISNQTISAFPRIFHFLLLKIKFGHI